jgi:predicted RNA-binding Zn-ribbon protein involved in translation (DUF1610 family)
MLIVNDCRCTVCDTVTEILAKRDELATLPCPNCGNAALRRMIGAPKLGYTAMVTNGESSSDSMNTSIDRWQKMRDQKAKIEARNMDRHGTET